MSWQKIWVFREGKVDTGKEMRIKNLLEVSLKWDSLPAKCWKSGELNSLNTCHLESAVLVVFVEWSIKLSIHLLPELPRNIAEWLKSSSPPPWSRFGGNWKINCADLFKGKPRRTWRTAIYSNEKKKKTVSLVSFTAVILKEREGEKRKAIQYSPLISCSTADPEWCLFTI